MELRERPPLRGNVAAAVAASILLPFFVENGANHCPFMTLHHKINLVCTNFSWMCVSFLHHFSMLTYKSHAKPSPHISLCHEKRQPSVPWAIGAFSYSYWLTWLSMVLSSKNCFRSELNTLWVACYVHRSGTIYHRWVGFPINRLQSWEWYHRPLHRCSVWMTNITAIMLAI